MYPVGWQSFEEVRKYNAPYVDKTSYIRKLLRTTRYAFLSRPRRFGKSLFISTLEAFFLGKKELFEGLRISDTETEWKRYPVLHFDMSRSECTDPDDLEKYLNNQLGYYEDLFKVPKPSESCSVGLRFGTLLENIHRYNGEQSVILIDEYDKGIVEVINNAPALTRNQNILRPFFSQLKTMDSHIRFAFITGVSRFRHYTLFSGMNNPDDISFDPNYAAICGFTLEEVKQTYEESLKILAKEYETSVEDITQRILQKYDGYRFSRSETHVLNPFGLLKAFKECTLDEYWLMTATSKVFVDFLKQSTYDLTNLGENWVTKAQLSALYDTKDPLPLLFQTGYLTISDFDREFGYKLKIPNGEVRSALLNDLAPMYLGISARESNQYAKQIRKCLEECDLTSFVRIVDSMIAKVPYPILNVDSNEDAYHLIVYSICMAIGVNIRCEEPQADGRPDLIAFTKNYIYIIEFKLDQSAKSALKQIEDNEYARPYLTDGRPIYLIGASFSSEKRNIKQWLIQAPDGAVTNIQIKNNPTKK